jgi:hypothetical protein
MVVVVIAVVVDAHGPLTSFDGVPGIAIRPETTLDCQSPGSGSAPVSSMPRGRWVLVVCRGRGSPVMRRPLVRCGALCLLCHHRLEEGLEVLLHSPLLVGSCLRVAAQQHGHYRQVL